MAVRLTRDGQERRDRLLAENKCLGCEHERKEGERWACGLCWSCFNSATYRIRRKFLTREELIRTGQMLPPYQKTRMSDLIFPRRARKQG